MTAPVTVVSCLYGDTPHALNVPAWEHALGNLTTRPREILVFTDRDRHIPTAHVYIATCAWRHPQAFYLDRAIRAALTEWVWIVDIDDLAMPDALDGLEDVRADVWMMGYRRSDGEEYVVPPLTRGDVLGAETSVIPGSSAIRTEAYKRCGGFPDVAFQDWALWRRLARAGATFESSGRAHFHYMRHPAARGETELTMERRPEHLAEMAADLADSHYAVSLEVAVHTLKVAR